MTEFPWISAAAAVCLAAAPGWAVAQSAHNYVAIATTTLPEPGDPMAVVFADLGSLDRAPGASTMDVLFALGQPQAIHGQPTAYVVFHYEIGCIGKLARIPGYEVIGPDGSSHPQQSTDPAHAAATSGPEAAVLAAACASPPAARKGYGSIAEVTTHAKDLWLAEHEHDDIAAHSFQLTGRANGSKLGAFDVYVDKASIEKSGDNATAETVQVFQRPLDASVQAGGYLISRVSFACSAKQKTVEFNVLYQVDGTPIEQSLVQAGPLPVHPGTIDEKMLGLVCNGADPGYLFTPKVTLDAALTQAWSALASKARQ
ncbi:MAG: surface-adhesin E family protein [Caulobacterales bacterium]